MSRYNNDPYETKARFNSTCDETGKPIKKGEPIIYYPKSQSVFKTDTKQAKEFYEWQADLMMMNQL